MEKVYHLPETGFLRIDAVLFFIPISESDWWGGVAVGKYPSPVKLGRNNGVTAWRAEDIRAFIRSKDPLNGQIVS